MSHNGKTCSDKRICQICKKKHTTGLYGHTPKQKAGDDILVRQMELTKM